MDEPGRRAAAGLVHPHRRRNPYQQLPAVAGGLRRVLFHRYPVARFRPGLPARGHRRLRTPRTPLWPHRRAGCRHHCPGILMLLQRVLTALILAPLAIAIVLWPPTGIFALLCAGAFLAAWWEWEQLSGLKSRAASIALLLVAVAVFALLWWGHAGVETPLLLLLGVAWWLVACLWLRHFAFAAAPTSENRALKLLAGALIIFPAWIALVAIHDREAHGHWWTMLALLIVWSADIGAYFSGRAFGKRKL